MPVNGYCFQCSMVVYIRRPVEGYAALIDRPLFVRPTHWVGFDVGVGWSIHSG